MTQIPLSHYVMQSKLRGECYIELNHMGFKSIFFITSLDSFSLCIVCKDVVPGLHSDYSV